MGAYYEKVTEGTSAGWSVTHSWDAAADTVTIETLTRTSGGPGSGWHYQLTSADGNHHQAPTCVPKSVVGRVLGLLIPLVGGQTLGKQLRSVFRKAEAG